MIRIKLMEWFEDHPETVAIIASVLTFCQPNLYRSLAIDENVYAQSMSTITPFIGSAFLVIGIVGFILRIRRASQDKQEHQKRQRESGQEIVN